MEDSVAALLEALSAARIASDEPHVFVVGERVRRNAQRGRVGRVARVDALGVLIDYEGEGGKTLEQANQLTAFEQCDQCSLWRAVGSYCNVGHWAALSAVAERALIGPYVSRVPLSREDRCVGVLLVSMIGDALGAPFEGFGSKKVSHQVGKPTRFCPGTHMGIRHAGLRLGMYTDDTNTLLALASALAEQGGLVDAQKIASSYATFFFDHTPQRGMPDSAQRVLAQVRAGDDIRLTGIRSFCFGSFANGAAMRISPVACVVESGVSADTLYGVVAECCVSSHVHPDAVDAAVVQARAVSLLLCGTLPTTAALAERFVDELLLVSRSEHVATRLRKIAAALQLVNDPNEEVQLTDAEFMEASGIDYGFQLYAPDAIATVLWFLLRYWSEGPEEILIRCVAFGGDCDTTVSRTDFLLQYLCSLLICVA